MSSRRSERRPDPQLLEQAQRALFRAALNGNAAALQAALDQGGDPASVDVRRVAGLLPELLARA